MKLVNVLKAAAQGLGPEKRVILLHGPVGSSKSTIVRMLKKGIILLSFFAALNVFGQIEVQNPEDLSKEVFKIVVQLKDMDETTFESKFVPFETYVEMASDTTIGEGVRAGGTG